MRDGIGKVLLVGVVLAAALVAAGGLVYLSQGSSDVVHYRIFRGEPTDLRELSGILRDAAAISGRGIIQFGLLVLVGLQSVRVALTAGYFARKGDWRYVAFSVFILAVLLYGLLPR